MQTTVKPYECDNCNKSVTQCVHLKPHQRTQTKVKPYHFDKCVKAFTQTGSLNYIKELTTGKNHFMICDNCDKTFASTLKKHLRIQRMAKYYVCNTSATKRLYNLLGGAYNRSCECVLFSRGIRRRRISGV